MEGSKSCKTNQNQNLGEKMKGEKTTRFPNFRELRKDDTNHRRTSAAQNRVTEESQKWKRSSRKGKIFFPEGQERDFYDFAANHLSDAKRQVEVLREAFN